MSPSPPRPRLVNVSRWGPLVLAILMGAALVASAAVNYQDVRAAAQLVAEREGMGIHRRLRDELAGAGDVPSAATLRRAIEAHEVSYIAIWVEGKIVAEAGSSLFPNHAPIPGTLQLAGNRARMTFGFPGFPGPPRGLRPPPLPPDSREGMRRPLPVPVMPPGFFPPPGLGSRHGPHGETVIEFDPVGTAELRGRALAGLWIASGAALLLTLAALVLWRLGRRAERMQSELERQRHLASLGAMSAVLAHEIRNPLASLKGHAQLLAEKPDSPRVEERIRRVVDEAVRLEALTGDLLEFARSGVVHPAPTAPARILEAAAQTTRPDRIQLDTSAAPHAWSLDAGRMEQVLVNLLDNALQATPDGAKVTASVARHDGELVYSVRDHGPGVPAADRARVFEPFHTTRIRGTGLGLAVARRIVDLHGGRIVVDDAPGGGALFRVHLPGKPAPVGV